MDRTIATRMEKELTGETIAGWRLEGCVGYGKSALVFRASRGNEFAAVKIFDRELVDRFGKEAQRTRVMRERTLVGQHHPNLIGIYAAGEDDAHDVFYVVMEFFDGKSLDVARELVPVEQIQPLLAQVASAARFLEGLQLAHRDIKPENIGVADDYSRAVLLDLGVIRPVGFGNITDDDHQKAFVATLRYSPPELLFREEQDSLDGWRAVTFYQLGGVLHDLLTRKVLFDDHSTPYARLVEAVRDVKPTIFAPDAPPDLVLLAENCLVKSPASRLALVSWELFEQSPSRRDDAEAARTRVARRIYAAGSAPSRVTGAPTARQRLREISGELEAHIRDVCAAADIYPPLIVQAHDPSDDHVCIRASFAASQGAAVEQPFAVFFELTIIDAEAGAIRVRIGATKLPSPAPCVREYEQRVMSVRYEGVLRKEALRQCVADALIISLDQAQATATTGGNSDWFRREEEQDA